MVGETAFPSPSEQSGATARPWGGRLVGMGTKKADRSSISKLEIGSETVMGDSRSAQNPKEEEGGRQRASGEGGKEGRPPARFTERAGICPSVRLQQPSVCVCEPPPASVFRGTGTAGSMGERRFTHPSFPTLRSRSRTMNT